MGLIVSPEGHRSADVLATSELPASASVADGDSRDEENFPVSDLSHYQKRCVAAYEKDLAFLHESSLSQDTNRHGLW